MADNDKKTRRVARQRRFAIRVTITFLLFCAVAAPFQFHIDWYARWSSNSAAWLKEALKSGPLYFYAFILCIEAFFIRKISVVIKK